MIPVSLGRGERKAAVFPHPSGIVRWYNSPRNKEKVAKLLKEVLAMPKVTKAELRVPQARVLSVLARRGWPMPARRIAELAGFTPVSGSLTRALHGLREGSSSGAPHKGLIDLRCVEERTLDVDGRPEQAWVVTDRGRALLASWLARHGALPELKDAGLTTNARYKKE